MRDTALDQLRIERRPENQSSAWRWLGPAILIVIATLATFYFWLDSETVARVRTSVAREVNTQVAGTVLNASGYVTARRRATVSSKFTARVTEVLIEEGMVVATGQVLARLDDSNISASFNLAQAQLVSAQKDLKETEALLSEARINYERSRRLVEQGLASEAELDRSRALAGSLDARLERKRADVDVAARRLDIFRQQLEDTIVRAPFAGVIVAKNAQPGEMISPISAGGGFTRTGIGTIVDMDSLEIEIDVNEAYINRVSPGQKVIATLDAWSDWKIPGHVIAIIPTADRERATVEVRVGFDQLDPRILPDMGVKVAFQEPGRADTDPSPRSGAVLVPRNAVRNRGKHDFVLVVDDGVVEHRAVATLGKRGSDLLLSSGLAPGETVVIEGPADLVDGDRVEEKQE